MSEAIETDRSTPDYEREVGKSNNLQDVSKLSLDLPNSDDDWSDADDVEWKEKRREALMSHIVKVMFR